MFAFWCWSMLTYFATPLSPSTVLRKGPEQLKIIAAQLSTIGAQLIKPILDPQLEMGGGFRETDLEETTTEYTSSRSRSYKMWMQIVQLEMATKHGTSLPWGKGHEILMQSIQFEVACLENGTTEYGCSLFNGTSCKIRNRSVVGEGTTKCKYSLFWEGGSYKIVFLEEEEGGLQNVDVVWLWHYWEQNTKLWFREYK